MTGRPQVLKGLDGLHTRECIRPIGSLKIASRAGSFIRGVKLPHIPPHASLPPRNERLGVLRIEMCTQCCLVGPAFRVQQPFHDPPTVSRFRALFGEGQVRRPGIL